VQQRYGCSSEKEEENPVTTTHAAPTRTGGDKAATTAAAPVSRLPSDFACKQVMAWTGLIFGLYVLVHMVGNMKAYLGPAEFDSYAVWLRHMLEPVAPPAGVLWLVRAVLLTCLVAHLTCATILFFRARARRGPFRRKGLPLRSFAARSMPVTGVVLLLFIIFHILDLTTGTRPIAAAQYTPMTAARSVAYDNLVHSFDRPWVSAFYILAMLLLGLHLSHGLWLAVNDLGATGRRVRQISVAGAGIVALAVMVGNISLPIAVLTGVVS
jgi:succinate dehydrogenase / fumarate reductase, cytochrome b subunit